MFLGLNASASGLTAEAARLNVVADNLANADSVQTPSGGPYRRQFTVLKSIPAGSGGIGRGVEVAAILPDPSPFQVVYDPASPLANAAGNILYPNVHVATEMVDLIAASRAYSANVTAFDAQKQEAVKALSMGG